MTIDQQINEAIAPISQAVAKIIFYAVNINGVDVPVVVLWLCAAAIIMTVWMNFINLRGFKHAIGMVLGHYEEPNAKGAISHFRALATALSGTVGLGNIAGVAVAISLGGPGATFWMILVGLLGMSTKFVECTLGVKYRILHRDGSPAGGPMHYLSKGLAEEGYPLLGKWLAIIFCVMCLGGTIGGGNMFQANQAFQQLVNVTGGQQSMFYAQGWMFGVFLAVMVGLVIIGGIKRIALVTGRLVPFMCGIYVLACLYVLAVHYADIPTAINTIITQAFAPVAVAGGFIGVLINGVRRALFSNEAGVGSSPIAHATVKTKRPITEGFTALLEPFIDTVVICTMTALVIVITGAYQQTGLDGVTLTSSAFGGVISWFPYLLAFVVFMFAYSTMISWSYYGVVSFRYLFGDTKQNDLIFKIIFCAFTIIGASMNLSAVIDFTDSMFFAMTVPNIIGLYILAPKVKKELDQYWKDLKSGKIKRYKGKWRLLG